MTQSNNNFLELELTAPGKVILFGEHSVVYGKKAVAATLGLYTRLHLKETDSDSITLKFPDIQLEETFSLSDVREFFSNQHESFTDAFENFYKKYGRNELNDGQRGSLITFFHSLPESCCGFTLYVKSDLPVGAGAGSSASFSVIVTAALLLYRLAKTNKLSEFVIRDGKDIKIGEKLLDTISEKAFACEKIFHGTPSGIDHNVILRGSALEFVKGSTLKGVDGGAIRVLLVNTKVPKSTKRQVEIFRRWKENYPDIIDNILNAMGDIASNGIDTLSGMKTNPDDMEKHEAKLADLISLNHGLLRCAGVSHDSLEKVCSFGKKYGLSAKLTGAGGGGFAFIYISSGTPCNTVQSLKQELTEAGFEATDVILGGPGLTIKSLSI